MSNAFARMVQARPCPTFGRPVRQRTSPSTTARQFSSCPSDSTSQWTPCPPVCLSDRTTRRRHPLVRLRRFRLRARLGFSVSFRSPASEVCPAFGYGAPHPSARGTLTLLIIALPSAHQAPIGIKVLRMSPLHPFRISGPEYRRYHAVSNS